MVRYLPFLFHLLLLVALVTSAAALPMTAGAQATVYAEIGVSSLNIRQGPGTAYPVIGSMKMGERADVTAVDRATGWLEIAYGAGRNGKGWITGSSDYVVVHGALGDVTDAAGKLDAAPVTAGADAPAVGGGGKLVFQTSSGGDIYLINADGTGLRKLTNGLDPALSPDGTMVAFARWSGLPRGLYVINVDGTGERLVYGWDASGLKAPTWSPDGKRIAFTFESGDITQFEACFKMPSPKGVTEKCFEGPRRYWWKLATIGSDGQDFRDLLSHDFAYSPSWSSDGQRIAYASDQGLAYTGEAPGVGHVLEDWNKWHFTRYQNDRSPAWSPDGHRLAFQTKSHDHWEIVVINDDGQGKTQITRSWPLADVPVNSVAPAWSPDGKSIVYLTDERGRWELWRMAPDGTEKAPFLEEALKDITFDYQSVDERVMHWGK